MSTRNGLRALVAASILFLGVSAAAADLGGGSPVRDPGGTRAATFRVKGSVGGLFPGAVRTMRVRLRNPHPFALRLRRLRISIVDPSPGCRAGTIRIARVRRGLVMASRRTTKVRVRVRMRPTASDACIGARYPLRFSGSAVRA